MSWKANNVTNILNLLNSTLETNVNNIERQLMFNGMFFLKIDEIVNDVRFKMAALLEANLNNLFVCNYNSQYSLCK